METTSDRMNIENRNFESEFQLTASRSSGPGGQHVNKVNTRIELRFSIHKSALLSPEEKELVLHKLKNRINSEGELILTSQSERSQLNNKAKVIQKFYELIGKALSKPKIRKASKPSKRVIEKRLLAKRKQGEKKQNRTLPPSD